jgi:nudix-type nucleoside diphosphatase (YffH/AdpP family)
MLYSGQDGPLLEVPAGLIEDEPADATARREAMEEAGIRIAEMEPVAEFWSMPGVSTERLSLYLAPYSAADRVGKGGGLDSEGEHIEVVEIPLSELARMADAGTLLDMKTFVAVQTLRLKAPDLFD